MVDNDARAYPRLRRGTIYDCLKAICSDNDVAIENLPPSVLAFANESLAKIASLVAEVRQP